MEPIKAIEVKKDRTWVMVYEFPGESIALEGVSIDEKDKKAFHGQRILFSKEAIEKITPILVKWLKDKKGEK